jgi:hypothetical protein
LLTFAVQNLATLMNFQALHNAKSIRFRRWSRAGYAIFCSLACSVTIGCVAISISDKSLQKAVGTSSNTLCSVVSDTDSVDKLKQAAELEVALLKIQESSIIEVTFDSAAACGQQLIYRIFNQNG